MPGAVLDTLGPTRSEAEDLQERMALPARSARIQYRRYRRAARRSLSACVKCQHSIRRPEPGNTGADPTRGPPCCAGINNMAENWGRVCQTPSPGDLSETPLGMCLASRWGRAVSAHVSGRRHPEG